MRRSLRERSRAPFPENLTKITIMKNLITITSLLAAGTLCASAETIEIDAFGYTELGGSEANKKTSSGSWTVNQLLTGRTQLEDLVGTSVDLSGYRTSRGNSEWAYGDSTTSVSFSNLSSALAADADGSLSLIAFDMGLHDNNSGSIQVPLFASWSLNLIRDGEDAKLQFVVADRSTVTSSAINLTDELTKISLDITIPYITSDSNANIATDTGASFSVALDGGVVSGLTGSFNPAANSGNTGSLTRLWLGDSGVTIGVVPEPSAFGLLAGLGALALVAARRRRQKKA